MMRSRATTGPTRPYLTAMIALCGALSLFMLVSLIAAPGRLNSDFMAFWAYPRFIAAHDPAALYDSAQLQAFEQQLYAGFHSFYPYLYPPTLLLTLSWLRALPFGAAELAWGALGIGALALACRAAFPGHARVVLAALLASPAALLCLATGETGLFTTALLLAGFAALPRAPLLAGLWFGLLTLKPQLGVMLPFFLLARREVKAILAACLTALVLNGASALIYPARLWRLWWRTLPAYQDSYFHAAKALNLNILITPSANIVALGGSIGLAWAVQMLCALAMAGVVIWAARRAPYRLAVAVTLVAGFLAQPHAYAYDSIAVVAALALALEARPGAIWVALGMATYLAPLLLLSPWHRAFIDAPLLAACLTGIITLAFAARNGADSNHEPDPLLPPLA